MSSESHSKKCFSTLVNERANLRVERNSAQTRQNELRTIRFLGDKHVVAYLGLMVIGRGVWKDVNEVRSHLALTR